MTPSTTKKPTMGREHAAGMKKYIPVLGAALLVVCLAAGIVQASVISDSFPNGNGLSVMGTGSGPEQISPVSAASNTCGEHSVDCYSGHRYIGTVDDAPCYFMWTFTCEPSKDLDTCKAHFGANIDRTYPATSCHYH